LEPGRERRLVTAALVLSMFLAALEATAVGTAMPTVIAELGGMSRYSWVFSAYLLTSTTTVPMYGKLADLFGRRRVFTVGVVLFLLGAALAGMATTATQLILFRALQGLGAGGVMPASVTLVGDIYTMEERGRMQGLFSAVWAVSSLAGPAAGGLLTDLLSWRWVFYINIPFGLVSVFMLRLFLKEEAPRREHRLDVAGTITLTLSIAILLAALLEGSERWGWSDVRTALLVAVAGIGLMLFIWQERRVAEPTLPLDLFRNPVIVISSLGNAIMGTIMFSAAAFVPMFAQGVLGGTAIDAGMTLAPMSIGWPIASTTSGWLLLRVGYRPFTIAGAALGVVGCLLLFAADPASGRAMVMLAMFLVGMGLGFMSTPYLLAVQNAVPWRQRGVATSSIQFFRTIGGAIAVAALGAALNAHLVLRLGRDIDANVALDPDLRTQVPTRVLEDLVSALNGGLNYVYLAMAAMAFLGLFVALQFPKGSAESHAHAESRLR
jgi:EmrB/QacA subfamily drug resistance transporter